MARSSRGDLFITVGGNVAPLKSAMTAGKSVLNEFGGAAIDISAEVTKALSNMAANAPAEARKLEQSYAKSFEQIRRNAQEVLKAPTQAGAVEVLNAAGARQAAQAAEAEAAALRSLADAAIRADTAAGGTNLAVRTLAVSSETAAQEAAQHAAALRAQAGALDLVQAELGGTAAMQQRVNQVSGQSRAGLQQLGFQLNDVAVQFAAGTPPGIIFSQQISQITQAVQLMSNGTSRVATFLGGPWGIALGVAVSALAPLVGKLFEGGDAADSLTGKLDKQSKQVRENEIFQAQFDKSIEGSILVMRRLSEEVERNSRSLKDNIALKKSAIAGSLAQLGTNIGTVGTEYGNAVDERNRLRQNLADAKAAPAVGGSVPGGGALARDLSIKRATEELEEADKRVADLSSKLTRMSAELDRGSLALDRFTAQSKKDLAEEAERERKKTERETPKPRIAAVTQSETVDLLKEVFGDRTAIGNTVRSAAHNERVGGAKNSHHLANQNSLAIDFIPAGGLKNFDKAAIYKRAEAAGIKVLELLGPGDKGHDDHGHIAVAKKRLTPEQVAAASARSARGAAAEAQRELSEDISFNNEERQLRGKLLDLQARSAENETQRNALLEADIQAEAEAYAKKIELVSKAGKLDKAEADRLLGLNEEVRQQRLRNLKIEEAGKNFARQADANAKSLDYDIQMLRLQLDLANTTAERRRIAAELLAAEQRQRRDALDRIRNDPRSSAEDIAAAGDELRRLPAIEQGERTLAARNNQSPLEAYKADLERGLGDIDERLEEINVQALRGLEDGLVGAAKKALGLKGALGDIVGELLRIGAQKAILELLGGSGSGGGGGGGGGGGVGGFFGMIASLGKAFGAVKGGTSSNITVDLGQRSSKFFRAGGGPVIANQPYEVGEFGREVFIPQGAGTILSAQALLGLSARQLPSIGSLQARPATHQQIHINVDAKDALLVSQVQRMVAAGMVAAADAGGAAGQARVNRARDRELP